MKKYIYTLFLMIVGFSLFGQQEVQSTYFMYNQQLNNPAYVGSRNVASFTALYRNQWAGFEGAPKMGTLSFQSPLLGERAAVGATMAYSTQGITKSWFTSFAYSYKVPINEDLAMRLGLQASIKYLGIDFSDDQVVLASLNDPSISTGQQNEEYLVNVGAGGFLTYKDQFYFGISVPQIYPNDIAINLTNTVAATNRPHLYINAGAKIAANENIEFSPNILLKYVKNAPLDLDINANVIFSKEFLVGLSYRTGGNGGGESIDLLAMYQTKSQLGIGASYDFTLSEIKQYNSGTFEILIHYDLGKANMDLENPRYF